MNWGPPSLEHAHLARLRLLFPVTVGNTRRSLEQDVWLSTSNDPADLVRVAEKIDNVPCRSEREGLVV